MNTPSRARLALATTLWKRPVLTDIVLGHYRRVQALLADTVDLTLLAVGSEGRASREISERNGFHYIDTVNQPVTYKWNAVIRQARSFEPDGVILVNSDDAVSANLLGAYVEQLSEGADYFGLRDAFIFDLFTGTLGRWPGYEVSPMQYRVGEPAGCARCFSRNLLETTGWRLWPTVPPRNSGMDFWCTQFLALFGYEPRAFTMAALGVKAIQLKTDVNITPFEVLPLTDITFGEPAWKAVEAVMGGGSATALQALHRTLSPGWPGDSGKLPDRNPSAGESRVHRIEDILPLEHRSRMLADLASMRRTLEAERKMGMTEEGVATVRAP